MTYAERLHRRHVRQTLRLGGVLLVVVGLGTALNWPAGGLEAVRASVHARPAAVSDCGEAASAHFKTLTACVAVERLDAR